MSCRGKECVLNEPRFHRHCCCDGFFFSSRRRHTRLQGDWSSDVCSSDLMTMVGSLDKKGVPTALVRVGTLLYQVRAGNYLGQNYGKVTRITETSIQLREIVQDGSGDWIERNSTLELQEGRK